MLLGAVTNIVLDPVFIFFFHMGVRGAALATILSQLISAIWILKFLTGPKAILKLKKNCMKLKRSRVLRIIGLGMSGFTMSITNSSVQVMYNAMLQKTGGDLYVGIMTVINTVREVISMPVQGITHSSQPVMGYNYGAKEYRRVNKIYRLALTIAIGIMTAGTLLFMFTPETFMKMFTTQETTIAAGASALRIISCGFIVSSVSVVSSGALEALGKGNESLVVSLLRYLVIIVPLAFVLSRFIGANGVWHSFWITETVTAFVAYGIYRKALRNK